MAGVFVLEVTMEVIVKIVAVSYTHLRAHETVLDLVCRLLLEKKKLINPNITIRITSADCTYKTVNTMFISLYNLITSNN